MTLPLEKGSTVTCQATSKVGKSEVLYSSVGHQKSHWRPIGRRKTCAAVTVEYDALYTWFWNNELILNNNPNVATNQRQAQRQHRKLPDEWERQNSRKRFTSNNVSISPTSFHAHKPVYVIIQFFFLPNYSTF